MQWDTPVAETAARLDALDRYAGFAVARAGPARAGAVRPWPPVPVAYAGGRRPFQVRGTCCLYYRSAAESGPPEQNYCNTCPLRDDDSRHRRLHDYLTDTPAEPIG